MLDFGSGVSRTLSAVQRQFSAVVWQASRPPLDSELNLMSQQEWEALRQVVLSMMPSGFIMDPTRSMADYQFDPSWSNFFKIGNPKVATGAHEGTQQAPVLWANVNGWVIPVVGTHIDADGDLSNFIDLYPAPESDARVDFIFLEAWQARVDANPATANKPSASTIWKYGNVYYGGTNLVDDLEDPTVGESTTARIQVQYRIRAVGSGTGLGASVSLDVYPDGLGDPNIIGQGAASAPVAGSYFTNMGKEGDPSLWRAGEGDPNSGLGTIDGYTYAIPICAVFRRNSNSYLAVNSAGNANQNGSFERTPGTKLLPNPLTGNRVLTTAQITFALSPTAGVGSNATISVGYLNGSGLEDFGATPSGLYLMLDDEIIEVTGIDIINGTITIPAGGRGRFGTAVVGHATQSTLRFYNSRSDGLFADQVVESDILDLRRAINANDWDYRRLLEHNVMALAKGNLRSSWKKAGAGDTQGPVIHEVDYLFADGSVAVPNQTEALDGPDGIRTVWSDASVIQSGVTLLLDNDAPQDSNHYVGLTNDPLDDSVRWDVGPDFYPSAFMNVGTGLDSDHVWTNGSLIFLYTGGVDGTQGARGTFRDGTTRAVRLATPQEFWKDDTRAPASGFQTPVMMRFLDQRALECAPPDLNAFYSGRHPGPMYPWYNLDFTAPFIVLGGLLRDSFKTVVPTSALSVGVSTYFDIDVNINFDNPGVFFSKDVNGEFEDDPTAISAPLLRGERTLWGMLTKNGTNLSGFSSEVYVITHGDKDSRNNNGVWQVVGAGTVGYTAVKSLSSTSLVCIPLTAGFTALDVNANNITVEIRSQYHNAEDSSSYQARSADVVIGLTDLRGYRNHPWYARTLGFAAPDGYDLSMPTDGSVPTVTAVPAKMLIDLTLMYYPGRGGMARIPDQISRFAMKGGTTENTGGYLRQSRVSVDPTFPVPEDETYWDLAHTQIWNRLPSLGLSAPTAPSFGGSVVGYTEQDREHEIFFDRGSKTLIFRPFRDREMTLQAMTFDIAPSFISLVSAYTYPAGSAKDCLELFTGDPGSVATSGKQMGFAVPYEWMPRFGRQDIPYWQRVGANDTFLPGINHLFTDVSDSTLPVFNVIGGRSNLTGGNEVTSFFFTTVTPASYGQSTTIVGSSNNIPAIRARKTTDINPAVTYASEVIAALKAVNSSDFGKGLKGIQLPPYYGPARVYGVYTTADYAAKGGRTFKANRYEMETDPCPNLLKEDATKQTLFILQDGAKDLTQVAGDHTYIIPSNALDLTRALTYQVGDTFESFNYIVECSVFGFSHDWITGNNFVLVRRYNGQGALNTDGDNPQLEGVNMTIPCPAGHNDQLYVAYDRTVYQGDPYMSRSGDAKTDSDYETRYGQISMANQYLLRTPIQQFDTNGDFVPQTPNARSFEILASMDFYTTLGTGKVGGTMYPGTSLDVNHTSPLGYSRMPSAATQPPWLMETRTFTEGQVGNPTKASIEVTISDAAAMSAGSPIDQWTYLQFDLADGSVVKLYGSEADYSRSIFSSPYSDLVAKGVLSADIFRIPVKELTFTWTGLVLAPGVSVSTALNNPPFQDMEVTDGVSIVTPSPEPWILLMARPLHRRVELTAINIWTPAGFESTDPYSNVQPVTITAPAGAFPANSVTDLGIKSMNGVTAGDVVVVSPTNAPIGFSSAGLLYVARYEAANQVRIYAYNPTGAGIGVAAQTEVLNLAILSATDAAAHTYTGDLTLDIRRLSSNSVEQETAKNLYEASLVHQGLLAAHVIAQWDGGRTVKFTSGVSGAAGNQNKLALRLTPLAPASIPDFPNGISINPVIQTQDQYGQSRTTPSWAANFSGGIDSPMNAGDGLSQINLTGMTERFPLGALLQDSDFLCEDPMRDSASAMRSSASGPRPVQSFIPMVSGDEEYTRFFGESGELVALSDGSISVLNYGAWTEATPTGTRKFRLYRGGGPLFMLSGENPGGPIDWVSDAFPPAFHPILKGGVLACRALLVRNYYEELNPSVGSYKVSDGDEIQMIIATYGLFGTPTLQQDGMTMKGIIGPAGYGEGYAAADRFRLAGKPMCRGFAQNIPDPSSIQVAVYPDEMRVEP